MDSKMMILEPCEMTAVMDYNHKVCFSVKPVKQCPKGTVADTKAFHEGKEQAKQTKVCLLNWLKL